MANLFFVLKTFILSALLIAGLQIKVGGQTIEEKTYGYIKTTPLQTWFKQVSHGAIQFTKSFYDKKESHAAADADVDYPEVSTDSDSALSLLDQ